MFKKMYVQITASYTGWIVIHINLLQTLYCLFDKSKNQQKGVLYEKWHRLKYTFDYLVRQRNWNENVTSELNRFVPFRSARIVLLKRCTFLMPNFFHSKHNLSGVLQQNEGSYSATLGRRSSLPNGPARLRFHHQMALNKRKNLYGLVSIYSQKYKLPTYFFLSVFVTFTEPFKYKVRFVSKIGKSKVVSSKNNQMKYRL